MENGAYLSTNLSQILVKNKAFARIQLTQKSQDPI